MAKLGSTASVLLLLEALASGASALYGARGTSFKEGHVYGRGGPSVGPKRQESTSCSGNITIGGQSDVANSAIASCTSYAGDIILDNATGNVTFLDSHNADFSLTVLNGSVYCRNNAGLETLALYGLTTITGSIIVDGAQDLQEIGLYDLIDVGAIRVMDAPKFTEFDLAVMKDLPILEVAGTAMTYESTTFSSLPMVSIGTLYIHDNDDLTIGALTFPNLVNITQSFVFENNGPNAQIDMNVAWINNMTLQGVQEVTLAHMIAVNGSLGISNSINLTTLAFQALEFVGGDFLVENNTNLDGLDVAALKTIGGSLIVSGDTALPALGTGGLQNVGALDLSGAFSPLTQLNSSFSSLQNVTEGITVVFTNSSPPVECSWTSNDKPPSGNWTTLLSCNNTSHSSGSSGSSGARSTCVGSAGWVISSVLFAVAYCLVFY